MADMLADLAVTEYVSRTDLTPKLVVMGLDPGAAVQPGYRFGLIPVVAFMTQAAGVPGEVVVAALIEKLAKDPDVLVVGHVAEGWYATYENGPPKPGVRLIPEDAPNREEVLMMRLRSADCMALKTCSLTRVGLKTTIGPGVLVFNPRACSAPQGRYTH